jgi:hypothetical protein
MKYIDCIADTNHEERPCLTVTERDSFLPNEKAWVFRWLVQTMMPTLLGQDFWKGKGNSD